MGNSRYRWYTYGLPIWNFQDTAARSAGGQALIPPTKIAQAALLQALAQRSEQERVQTKAVAVVGPPARCAGCTVTVASGSRAVFAPYVREALELAEESIKVMPFTGSVGSGRGSPP